MSFNHTTVRTENQSKKCFRQLTPGAVCVAERIRSAFEAEPIVIERDKVAITVSLGIAVSGGTSSFDAESLLHMADEALYRAKQMGRNRVELAVAPEHAAVPSSDSPSADHVMKAESR
jgi:GGDEF domain-containing protein